MLVLPQLLKQNQLVPASPQTLLTKFIASESGSRSLQRHPSDRKRLLTWVADIDTEQQLAKLRTQEIQGRWLNGLTSCTAIFPGTASYMDWIMQICASPYKSSQTLPQRPTIYGDGEPLTLTPVVGFVGSRVRCVMF